MRVYYKPVDGVIGEKLDKYFKQKNSFVEVIPGNCIMPKKFIEICDEVLSSNVRETDMWLLSYPRSGKRLLTFFI